MSDRMSNVEIEDVISSIRKLVEQDEPADLASADEGERLVLGQSQLVDEVEAKAPKADGKAKVSNGAKPEPAAEPETVAAGAGPLKLGEAIRPKPAEKIRAEAAAKAGAAATAGAAPKPAEPVAPPEPAAAAEPVAPPEPAAPEVEVPKSEPELSSEAEEAKADAADEDFDPVIDGHAEELVDWEPAEGVPGHAFGQGESEVEDADLAEVEEPAPPKAEVLMFSKAARNKIRSKEPPPDPRPAETEEKLKAAEAKAKPAPEPAATAPEEKADKAPEPAAASTAEPDEAKPAKAAEPEPTEDETAIGAGDEAAGDKADVSPGVAALLEHPELRAVVAEILREELKGPLGERITRNVRKMVRREIANALSGLDID